MRPGSGLHGPAHVRAGEQLCSCQSELGGRMTVLRSRRVRKRSTRDPACASTLRRAVAQCAGVAHAQVVCREWPTAT